MGYFIKLNDQNMVQEATFAQAAPDNFVEVDLPQPFNITDLANMMLVNGVLVPRPVSPKPYSDSGKIIVPPCPEGTLITVLDQSGREVMAMIVAATDDHEETFEFVDAGTYRVEVEAPSPHIYSFTEVTIE